jgi:hypothetical protein
MVRFARRSMLCSSACTRPRISLRCGVVLIRCCHAAAGPTGAAQAIHSYVTRLDQGTWFFARTAITNRSGTPTHQACSTGWASAGRSCGAGACPAQPKCPAPGNSHSLIVRASSRLLPLVSSAVASNLAKEPDDEAFIENATTDSASGNSQMPNPSYSPKAK